MTYPGTDSMTNGEEGTSIWNSGRRLDDFLEQAYSSLADDELDVIISQAAFFLENLCVHLPEGYPGSALNPLEEVEALRRKRPGTKRQFYNSLLSTFAGFGDRHTHCQLPAPFANQVAFLPFVVREFFDGSRASRFAILHSAADGLNVGDLVTTWNGFPIEEAIHRMMPLQLGANGEARRSKAIQTLTFRPLAWLPPPETDAEIEVIRDHDGYSRKIRLSWNVTELSLLPEFAAAIFGGGRDVSWLGGNEFEPRTILTRSGEFGYIRLASMRFAPDEFLKSLLVKLESIPDSGLILDLRGCRTGVIPAAEQLLQLFTDRPIQPLLFQIRNTHFVQKLVRTCPALNEWSEAIETSLRKQESYSDWRALTTRDQANGVGRRYAGPVVLLVDALTYSSAEVFSAGFQDHSIGPVVGTAGRTGGGGASCWNQSLIAQLSGEEALRPIPGCPWFRVAVQRCRRSSGELFQGHGVVPDITYLPGRRDIFEQDVDLIEGAGKLLARNRNKGIY